MFNFLMNLLSDNFYANWALQETMHPQGIMLWDTRVRRNSFVRNGALCEDFFFSVEVCNGARWSFCEEHFKVY